MFLRIISATSASKMFAASMSRYYLMSLISSCYETVGLSWLIIWINNFSFSCLILSFSRSSVLHFKYYFHSMLKLVLISSNIIVSLSFLSFYFNFKTSLLYMLRTIWVVLFSFDMIAPYLMALNINNCTFAILVIWPWAVIPNWGFDDELESFISLKWTIWFRS